MYDIYISNYLDSQDGQSMIETERPFYSIPITDSRMAVTDPVIKNEMGKTGSMEFSISPGHPFYYRLLQMKTIIRVEYDETTIFRGRVLTIDDQPMTGVKKIHLEGDLAFLMDSQQPGVKEGQRDKITLAAYLTKIISQHNYQMTELGDDYKRILPGELPGNYSGEIEAAQRISGEDRKYGSDGWQKTQDALSALQKEYGGYFRTRFVREQYTDTIGQWGLGNIDLNNRPVVHNPDGSISTEISFSTNIDGKEVLLPTIIDGVIRDEDYAIDHYISTGQYLGKFDTPEEAADYAWRLHERQNWFYGGQPLVDHVYLDWLEGYFDRNVNSQPIRLKENLIDISGTTEVNNLFTVLVPIGSSQGNPIYLEGYKIGNVTWGKKYITVPEIVPYCTDAELNKGYHQKSDYENALTDYGAIFKPQSFQDADTQEKLWNEMKKWILDNYVGGVTSFTVSALDMHHINRNVQKYLTGGRVYVLYPDMGNHTDGSTPLLTRLLTIISGQYYLHNPDKDSFTIGTPNNLINKAHNKSSSKKGSESVGSQETEEERRSREYYNNLTHLSELAWKYVVTEQENNEEYQRLAKKDKKKADLALHATHIAVMEGLEASDSRPTSGIHKQRMEHIIFDGPDQEVSIIGPYNKDWLTEDNFDLIWEMSKSATISGLKSTIGLNGVLDVASSTLPKKSTKTLLEMKINSGNKSTIKLNPPEKMEDDTAKETVGIAGFGGIVSNVMSKIGKDGTGNLATIFQDGANSLLSTVNPQNAGSEPGNNKTSQIDGTDGSAGFGGTKTSGGAQKWKITISKPITYTDDAGVQHTTPAGTVFAEDFSLVDVPSFKTRMAWIETAIIEDLYAVKATIDNLTGDTIVADTSIRSDKIRCNVFSAYTQVSSPSYILTGVPQGEGGETQDAYLKNCFSECTIAAEKDSSGKETGKISFTFYKIGGGSLNPKTFNLASTQFYKDGVEAAEKKGQDDVKIVKGSWSGGKISFSKSVGKADTKSIQLMASTNNRWGTGDNKYKYYVNIWEYIDEDTHAATGFPTITVDAGFIYVEGCEDGWSGCYDTVTIKPSSNPSALDPGGNIEVAARAKETEDGSVKDVKKITVSARSLRLQELSVTPGSSLQEFVPGLIPDTQLYYDGFSKVTVAAAPAGDITASADEMTWDATNHKYYTVGRALSDGTEVAESDPVYTPAITATVDAPAWDSESFKFYSKGYAKGGSDTLYTTGKNYTAELTLSPGGWSSGSNTVSAVCGGLTLRERPIGVPTPITFRVSTEEEPSGATKCNGDMDLVISSIVKSITFTCGGKSFYFRLHKGTA